MPIEIIRTDITRLPVQAIVNAANPGLLGGGGVDGAIHRAAGPQLLAACRSLPEVSPGVRCPTGEARITAGYALPAAHVIHTVGPVWQGGRRGEAALLESCYRACMRLCRELALASVAFPAISCGVYGYPPEQAAPLAIATLRDELAAQPSLRVLLCCFDAAMEAVMRAAFSRA